MCGRYIFAAEQNGEAGEMLAKLNAGGYNDAIKTGEIRPTDQALILISEEKGIVSAAGRWGFPKFDGKGVIINARVETAFEKKIFRDSLVSRRCIIPSNGFYEWDHDKRQFLFHTGGAGLLYMAGIYNFYQGQRHYVILTTQANESIRDIHDRMPLVISEQERDAWITNPLVAYELMKKIPPMLTKETVKKHSYGYQYRMDL